MPKIFTKQMSVEDAKDLGTDNWGYWDCEPATFDWTYFEQETAYILEGDVIVTSKYETVHITENMLVSFPKGLTCTWEIRKTIKKKYIFNFPVE